MTSTNKILIVLSLCVLLLAGVLMFKPFYQTYAEGWTPVHIQSATSTTVGTTPVTLFADETSPTCHSRVVTTNGIGIMISFDEVAGHSSSTLSSSIGHWQPASTTVAYDSAIYGCGWMTARATANTPVTISSF